MPQYVIEPPDILTIKAVQVVTKSPYRIRVLDVLAIQATDSVPDASIGRFSGPSWWDH